MKQYILVGHTPFETEDMKEWANWFEHSAHERRVALTQLALMEVSTVFTGVDYRMGGGGSLPLLFETAVFNEQRSMIATYRTRSWEEALAKHEDVVKSLVAYTK